MIKGRSFKSRLKAAPTEILWPNQRSRGLIRLICERNFRNLTIGQVFNLEKFGLLEAKALRNQIAGERLDLDSEFAHSAVVVSPGQLNLLLNLFQLTLQLHEILVRSQFRIVFSHGK